MSTVASDAIKSLKREAHVIAQNHPWLTPFLPLLGIVLHAVHAEQTSTGHDTSGAVTSVASTLTPGLANSPTLTDSTDVDSAGVDGGDVDAAADAAETGAPATTAVQAVQAQPDAPVS